jgi:hypothetical protein
MHSIVKCSTVAAALATLALAAPPARAGFDPLEPLDDLRLAVHASLGLPEPDILHLVQLGAPEPDLPVIGFLSVQLGQPPATILQLHLGGLPWVDIALRFGRGPEIFYVPFEADPGPPYGKAWGYYKKTPRARWNTIRLTDAEVFDLVNVRVCHDYYRVPYDRIVQMRRSGHDYRAIHHDLAIQTGKHGHGQGAKGSSGKGSGSASGKGKGKDKGKGGPPNGHGSGNGHGHGR